MRTRVVVAISILACATTACVGDDTVVASGPSGVQGGSGPPPSSYEDATLGEDGEAEDAGEDSASSDDAGVDATLDASDASADGLADAPGDADAGGG